MTPQRIDELISIYRDGLLNDTLPFWIEHCVDRECGGFFSCLDRDGSIIDTDKSVWVQGRFSWLLATLYSTVEKRPEWLELARHGIDFLRAHCFDSDGRMFFTVTREGKPLRKRRYLFSELFAIFALSAFARAAGDDEAAEQAVELFRLVVRYHTTPGLLEPKLIPGTRRMKGLSMPMMLIVTAQMLREAVNDPICDEWIDRSIEEVQRDFLRDDLKCVLESVGPNGEFIDHFDGRLLTPGHAIEAGWFILHEALHRGRDAALTDLGCKIIDYSWDIGWDQEYGGLLYFRDAKGLPSTEYWQDMKFWWPHSEGIIATLLAYHLTGNDKYLEWHRMLHDWTYKHFPDPEYGEWFGYLRRDGHLSVGLKGNLWKGPFHIPRMQWYCWQLLERMKGGAS